MRNKDLATVQRLLTHARYEVLPTATIEAKVLESVRRPSVTVTVTASPSMGLDPTLDLAERLAAQGYTVVPHLAARMVTGRAELEEIVRPAARGRHHQRVRARRRRRPAGGDYPDALSMLEDLTALGSPFERRRGHRLSREPPDDPRRPDRAVDVGQAQARHPHRQQPDLRPGRDQGLGRTGCGCAASTLPLLLGVPGPVERTKLLGMATKIGVGDSTRFLAKQKGLMARLVAPGGFTGESFLEKCAPTVGEPEMRVTGLHVYTFNQVAETEAWRQDWLNRLAG